MPSVFHSIMPEGEYAPSVWKIGGKSEQYFNQLGEALTTLIQNDRRISLPNASGSPFLTGRVSMDLLSCDITDISEEIVFEGASGYIIDKEHDVMRYTDTCGIMGYEAMTHFNDRIERVYTRR